MPPPVKTTRLPGAVRATKSALANRERAYIAASRRRDRSDEARWESALRGSEIHKELTGKALIITREIVMNGGEYVEEDPAFERLLARRLSGPTNPTPLSGSDSEKWTAQSPIQFLNGYPYPLYFPQSPQTPLATETPKEDKSKVANEETQEHLSDSVSVGAEEAKVSPWINDSSVSLTQQDWDAATNDFVFMSDFGMAFRVDGRGYDSGQNQADAAMNTTFSQDMTGWVSDDEFFKHD